MEYTINQRHLHNCQVRLRGLTVQDYQGLNVKSELNRITAARAEIISRMSAEEVDALDAHDNRVLTPAQLAEEAKRQIARMSENKDSQSI